MTKPNDDGSLENNELDAKSASNADPLEALKATLFNKGKKQSADVLKNARVSLSAIVAAKRPWEQLPSGLKSAARADAQRVLGKAGDGTTLKSAGYSSLVTGHLLRDLGRV